jgi:GTP-binding protein EngB required for normal cell division
LKVWCLPTVIVTIMGGPKILLVGHGKFVSGYSSYSTSIALLLSRWGYNDVHKTTDIVDTLKGPLYDARCWISRNSLRRLEGQDVKVVCALDFEIHEGSDWVEIMTCVFTKCFPCVALLQRSSEQYSEALQKFLSRLDSKQKIELEALDDKRKGDFAREINALDPFKIKIAPIATRGEPNAWSSEKVILFGRTGSGKSTIAQMLTVGRLDPGNKGKFKASSSARGVTSEVCRDEGRGWHVTDTPGFGEAKEGTVSTTDATQKLKKFVMRTCGIYSHFLYVVKKDRMNVYDTRLWHFFTKVFAEAEKNFSVVVTGCTRDQLTSDDMEHLKKTFPECNNFIFVNFCPIDSEDAELEEENEEVRGESLKMLEDGLAELGNGDIACKEGQFSKDRLKFVKGDFRAALFGSGSGMGANLGVYAVHYLVSKPLAALGGYLQKSEIDENIVLLPQ